MDKRMDRCLVLSSEHYLNLQMASKKARQLVHCLDLHLVVKMDRHLELRLGLTLVSEKTEPTDECLVYSIKDGVLV